MPLFGNKKKKEMADEIREAVVKEEEYPGTEIIPITRTPHPPQPRPIQKIPEETSGPAPVFMKLERYKDVLREFEVIKAAIDNLRNSFSALLEMERMRSDNMELMKEAIDGVEKGLLSLDRVFVRPEGLDVPRHELKAGTRKDKPRSKGMDTTISDLKSQIDELKEKLKEVA